MTVPEGFKIVEVESRTREQKTGLHISSTQSTVALYGTDLDKLHPDAMDRLPFQLAHGQDETQIAIRFSNGDGDSPFRFSRDKGRKVYQSLSDALRKHIPMGKYTGEFAGDEWWIFTRNETE